MRPHTEPFRCLLIAMLTLLCAPAQAQYPMTVTTNAPFPPPLTYAELLDACAGTMVTIDNSGPDRLVRARVTLRNETAGIAIITNDMATVGNCVNITAGIQAYSIAQLSDLFSAGGVFNPGLFLFSGTDAATIEREQLLPGPSWELCIQLLDCNLDEVLSEPLSSSCSSFIVPGLTPPQLTTICDQTVTIPDAPLIIGWIYFPPIGFNGDINYQLRIVPIEPEQGREGDANDAMLSATNPIFYNVVHDESPAIVEIPAQVPLVAGTRYAVRVTAGTGEGGFFQPLSNNAQSEVCSFLYAPLGMDGNGLLQALWPSNGQWIPFDYLNFVTFFEPYHPYTAFDYLTTVRSEESGALPDYSRHLPWPNSPEEDQSNATNDIITTYESQHLSVYHPSNTDPSVVFKRGEHYHWRTVGDFTLGSDTYHGDTGEEPFQVGMGESHPISPADGAELPAGDVTLRWRTADVPDPMLPAYYPIQAISGAPPMPINGDVHEKWELQISRESSFDSIWHSQTGMIEGAGLDLLSAVDDPAAFEAAVYKELEETIPIAQEGTYYWRLHWKKDPTDANSANYNTSDTWSFCVGECDSTDTDTIPTAEGGPCVSECLEPAPTNTTAVGGLAVGATVRVGKFNMEVESVDGSGTTFTGNGKIEVPFLNHAKIKVAFTGLRVNSDGRMIAGEVEGRKDWNPASLTMVTDGIRQIPSLSESDVDAMNGFLLDGNRLVSLMSSGSEMGLPIGIDQVVDGRTVLCGIIGMRFGVTRASLDMAAGIELPEIHTTLAFGVGDLCFTPNGLGDEGRAYLPYDVPVTGDLATTFSFQGGASTSVDSITYVDWDCDGFKCLQVACAVEFDRGTLLPAGDHDLAGTEEVEAHFKFQVCRELSGSAEGRTESWNVLAQFTMDPFEVPGAPGWLFTVEEAWLDWSTVSNPTGISFPEDYDNPALNNASTANTWKGFFIKQLAMTTPEVIGDGTGEPIGGSVNNFIIDDGGLSFNFALTNLLAINQGQIDSTWAFSVDSVYMDMRENTFQRAGLGGRLGMPINRERDYLGYSAILGYDDATHEFAFTLEVRLEDTLTVPMWIATMELYENSYVRATLAENSKVRAELNGRINISTALASEIGVDIGDLPSISMPEMEFTGLVLDSDDGISCSECTFFGFASPQKEMGGFPLSIRQLTLELSDPKHPALVVEPMITLSGGAGESSFAASVALKFTTSLELDTGGVKRFAFQDVMITGIHLDVEVSSMRLVGDVRITKTATKEEVKGALAVSFPMGIRGEMQAIFGTIRNDVSVPINTSAQHYNYWMVDGMVYFNPGLMIMTGVGIYGFGGGAYHHMRFEDSSIPENSAILANAPQAPMDSLPPVDPTAGDEPPNDFRSGVTADASTVGAGPAPSGGTYTEDFGTLLGIRLGLVFGTYPDASGCNMDLSLQAEFATSTGAMSSLRIDGNLYGLVSIAEREDARITGEIHFNYYNHEGNEVIEANLAVMLNYDVARGAGTGNKLVDATFHTESLTGQWSFIMGTPDLRGGIEVGPEGAAILTATSYIMVGNHGIPYTLPDPPVEIMAVLGLNDPTRSLGTEAETAAEIAGTRSLDMATLASGEGFAFGAGFEMNMDISLVVLYAKFDIMIGFDLLLSKVPEGLKCAKTGERPGDHGWYAQGQFYAGLWGELGVQLDLVFAQFRAPILEMSAAMLLQGNFPNPSGFRGDATVHFSVLNGAVTADANFHVEGGQQCTLMNAGDPLQDIQFIEDLGPKGEGVSIFDLPTASYNLPVQEVLEIPKVIHDDGSVEMYRFRPYISAFTLRDDDRHTNVPGNNRFGDDRGTSSYLDRINALEPETEYTARVEVRVREESAPGVFTEFVNPETHAIWSEADSVPFETGEAPDHILDENVDYTYPVNRQRYFLQGESYNKGRVRLAAGTGVPYLFEPTVEGRNYTYVAKYIPLGGGDALEAPISYSGGLNIPLDIPGLDPETIYIVQLLRRFTGMEQGSGSTTTVFAPGINIHQVSQANIIVPLTARIINAVGYTAQYNLTGGSVEQATALAGGDHLLYTFRFRTSQFNTLPEKFAALDLEGSTPARFDDSRFADVRGDVEEGFGQFDLYGFWKGDRHAKLDPLVTFKPDFSDSYYEYLINYLYEPYWQYAGKRIFRFPNGDYVDPPTFPLRLPLCWGGMYHSEPVVGYKGWVDEPLSNAECEDAAEMPEATSGMPTVNLSANGFAALGLQGSNSVNLGLVGNVEPLVDLSQGNTSTSEEWPNFGFLYRAGKHAEEDLADMRTATFIAMLTRSNRGSHLYALLGTYGPVATRSNMNYLVWVDDEQAALRHTGNLPAISPSDEFPVYYDAEYHVKMNYRSPIAGSRNSVVNKPFTLNHEEPIEYFLGTVLHFFMY